jgi:nucleoside diphosphate kinase
MGRPILVDLLAGSRYNAGMNNTALIFIKPHAVGEESTAFMLDFLKNKGIAFHADGSLTAEEIDSRGIVDRHYFAIATAAVTKTPDRLELGDEARKKFSDTFGAEWSRMLSDGKILNCAQARERLDTTGRELNERWKAGVQTKLAPGLYVGYLESEGFYLVNGFYLGMRELFTTPGEKILWFIVEFDPEALPWKTFRGEVIGATDPAKAVDGSLRRILYRRWEELGLSYRPTVTENGIHASAGPLEGLRERIVWAGARIDEDQFARALLSAGIARPRLEALLENPVVALAGETDHVFDLTEDMDSEPAVELLSGSAGISSSKSK